jgi:hypothetical protein
MRGAVKRTAAEKRQSHQVSRSQNSVLRTKCKGRGNHVMLRVSGTVLLSSCWVLRSGCQWPVHGARVVDRWIQSTAERRLRCVVFSAPDLGSANSRRAESVEFSALASGLTASSRDQGQRPVSGYSARDKRATVQV